MEKRDFNNRHDALPNFCRLGVFLRIVLAVEAALIYAALASAADWRGALADFFALSVLAQPTLLLTLLAFCAANRRLAALPYPLGAAAAVALAVLLTAGCAFVFNHALFALEPWSPLRAGGFALAAASGLLGYFRLRDRALSPALAEARLQALQSRIRPHFLFNSLNAVLSLIRSDPRRAETALEDLSELYRALMSDARRLVPLAEEVALARRYLDVEQLRLGDRLCVTWHVDKMPADALVPPLLLQPLVENAVYHGIEPAAGAGEIQIDLYRSRDAVHIVVRNPLGAPDPRQKGNHMALDNIRERLLLFFDLDACLDCGPVGGVYQVHIVLPYTRHAAHPDR